LVSFFLSFLRMNLQHADALHKNASSKAGVFDILVLLEN